VLDACAAPGGKTFLIAEKMRLSGQLVAMDIHADRLLRLRENLCRLGLDRFVEVKQCDMLKASLQDVGIFDRILLDVPCTNTGVIRRKPDVRWRFSEARLAQLIAMQKKMLDRTSRYLKPHGVLAYSTCSLEPEENEDLIAFWLKNHTRFHKISEKKLFPPQSGTDGAYVALLQRQR